MSWSMKTSLWICLIPTPPSNPRTPTRLKTSPWAWARPLSNPTLRHTPSRPVSLPSCSPGSCPARGCPTPSTRSLPCLLPSRCTRTPLCHSTELVWKTGMWFSGCWKVSKRNVHRLRIAFHRILTLLFIHRLCRCHRKAQLPELCLLPGPAWAPSLPAWTPGCHLPASSSGDSCGRAGEPRSPQFPVEVQTGRKHEEFYRGQAQTAPAWIRFKLGLMFVF